MTRKEYEHARAEAGLCVNCDNPRVTADRCEHCRRNHNKSALARYWRQHKRKQTKHCLLCGQPGHMEKTCTLEAEYA